MIKLIAALGDNIRQRGNKWVARCPVHNDKDFALDINQLEDGSVIAHCHACHANGLDLYQSLGLDLDELFGGKQREFPLIPHSIKETYQLDRIVIAIYNADKAASKHITLEDKRRYKLAVSRREGIRQKYNI